MHCTTTQEVAGSIIGGVIGIFYLLNHSSHTMVPGFDSTSNGKQYQGYLLRVKGPVHTAETLPGSCDDCQQIVEVST
jgi:hypothetical protein